MLGASLQDQVSERILAMLRSMQSHKLVLTKCLDAKSRGDTAEVSKRVQKLRMWCDRCVDACYSRIIVAKRACLNGSAVR